MKSWEREALVRMTPEKGQEENANGGYGPDLLLRVYTTGLEQGGHPNLLMQKVPALWIHSALGMLQALVPLVAQGVLNTEDTITIMFGLPVRIQGKLSEDNPGFMEITLLEFLYTEEPPEQTEEERHELAEALKDPHRQGLPAPQPPDPLDTRPDAQVVRLFPRPKPEEKPDSTD